MAKKCPNCGKMIANAAKFCPVCGAPFQAIPQQINNMQVNQQNENQNYSGILPGFPAKPANQSSQPQQSFQGTIQTPPSNSPSQQQVQIPPQNIQLPPSSPTQQGFNPNQQNVPPTGYVNFGPQNPPLIISGNNDESWKEKLYSYQGRLNRKPFFLRGLALGVVQLILNIIIEASNGNTLIELVALAISLALSVAGIMLGIRRMHDLDKPGRYVILGFIPFVNFYYLWLVCKKGTTGPNKYGPDPLL